MSAIAGILYFDGAPIEPGLIEKLTTAMRRRGPDEQTHWVQGSVALGHCMLRTTPESLEEHQPLISQDKNLVLVWDGRLDNREEVQRDLIAAGASLRDSSDAELTLHSYERWGEESPKRLLGDFAFAVWDTNKRKLFCARDHMGARPFYYSRNDRFFAFASEEEALLNLPGVAHRPNDELIAHFLVQTFLDFDHTRSWLEDVRALSAAQRMKISLKGEVQSEIYWHLEPGKDNDYASDAECREAFLQVFGEAVRCRMRSSGSIAAMMSGGMDSASIAAMIKRLLPETRGKAFHTYSAISDQPETCVESQCIQSLTKDLGDHAHFVSVPSFTGMISIEDLIDVGWSKPHPVDNSILLPAMMCLAAARDGHRVMLHGVSGDLTTHAPSQYIAHLLLDGRWWGAWNECQSASHNHTYLCGTPPVLLLLRSIWSAYAPNRIKSVAHKLRRMKAAPPHNLSLINPEFAAKHRLGEPKQLDSTGLPRIQQAHIQALTPPHGIASGISAYDRVAGHYGIEARDPWADKRVVEFFLRLPLKYKVRDGWTKYIVRTSFDLTPDVRWRLGKEHLGWGFVCRLLDETHGLVTHTIEQSLDEVNQYVDVEAVRKKFTAYCAAKGDLERHDVYDTMTLIHWTRRIKC